jgi:hypothetical protein
MVCRIGPNRTPAHLDRRPGKPTRKADPESRPASDLPPNVGSQNRGLAEQRARGRLWHKRNDFASGTCHHRLEDLGIDFQVDDSNTPVKESCVGSLGPQPIEDFVLADV